MKATKKNSDDLVSFRECLSTNRFHSFFLFFGWLKPLDNEIENRKSISSRGSNSCCVQWFMYPNIHSLTTALAAIILANLAHFTSIQQQFAPFSVDKVSVLLRRTVFLLQIWMNQHCLHRKSTILPSFWLENQRNWNEKKIKNVLVNRIGRSIERVSLIFVPLSLTHCSTRTKYERWQR